MANINDVLINIQELTNKNLKILEALNDSFYTSREHISLELNDATYTLPSFISLENKINTLSDNFYNLINAPKTGEAAFVFGSDTQKIQMKSFTNTPLPLETPNKPTKFEVENNDVLKDLLTPMPYVKWDITSLPDDIKFINVKKLIPKNSTLKSRISNIGNTDISYGNIYKKLADMTEDIDYIVYDTLMRVPIKDGIADGLYTIADVSDKTIDNNLDEYYTIRFNEDLTYKIKNGTIQKEFKVGDKLVTTDDKTMFEIIELSKEKREVKVQVLGGAYYDLTVYDAITDLDSAKLRILQETTELSDRYLQIPLEEDEMVCIFVAPVNELNVQAPWSDGLILSVNNLQTTYNNKIYRFRDFYNLFVNNIGDTLMEVSAMMSNYLNNYTEAQWNKIKRSKPIIDTNCFQIIDINTHFDNSEPAEKIRKLYQQIKDVQQKISAQVSKIAALNKTIAETTYNSNSAQANLAQNELNVAQNELTNLRNTQCALDMEFSTTAASLSNTANPNYHIRGYFDYEAFSEANALPDIVKIELQYRYRTVNQIVDKTLSLNDGKFIYSEWKLLNTPYRKKLPAYDTFRMVYDWQPNNNLYDEPSWNQIDIPIQQGEFVEMKIRVLYDLGRPFVEAWSDWSNVVNYTFPSGFVFRKSMDEMIQENASSSTQNMIINTLSANGILNHVGNQVPSDGSGITYYHQPDNIASGFRNENDNKIISLRDKLFSMSNEIKELEAIVNGIENPLEVTMIQGDSQILLNPFSDNNITVPNYSANQNIYPNQTVQSPWKYVQFKIRIQNVSKYPVRLYSLFRGPTSNTLDVNTRGTGNINDYITNNVTPYFYISGDNSLQIQKMNQIIYFRVIDAYNTSTVYYYSGDDDTEWKNIIKASGKLYGKYPLTNDEKGYVKYEEDVTPPYTDLGASGDAAMVYPVINSFDDISIPANTNQNYFKLNSGEFIEIPINFDYVLSGEGVSFISKIISFDIKHSLYQDANNYKVKFTASQFVSPQELVLHPRIGTMSTYNSIVAANQFSVR